MESCRDIETLGTPALAFLYIVVYIRVTAKLGSTHLGFTVKGFLLQGSE